MAGEDLTLRMRTKGARSAAKDVDQTTRSVRELDKSTHGATRRSTAFGRATGLLRSPLHHLRGEVGGLAKSFVGMGLAFGSVEGIKKSIETTDDLVKTTVQLHHQFGLTTEAASGLAGVMQARNLAPTGLRMGLTALSKQMQATVSGNQQAAAAFGFLGISTDEVSAALDAPDGLSRIFEKVVERMSAMPGGANKAAYGQLLLGRAQRSLSPLLQEGALGLQQQLKWAKEFGVTLDGHTVGSVEDMAAAQTKAQYAALGLQIQLGEFLAPALTTMNETFADTIKSFRDGRPEGNKFSKTIYRIGKDLEPVGKDLKDVGGYLVDHPRLLQAAGLAYIGYKTKLLSLLTMAPKAYLKGLITGRAFAAGMRSGGAGAGAAGAAAGERWFTGFSSAAGTRLATWIPPVVAVTVAIEFAYHLNKVLANLLHIPADGTKNNTVNRLLNPGGVVAGNVLHGRSPFSGMGATHLDPNFHGVARLPGGNPQSTVSVGRNGRITGIDVWKGDHSVHPRRFGKTHVGEAVRVTDGGDRGWMITPKFEVVIHHTTKVGEKVVAKETHREVVKARSTR